MDRVKLGGLAIAAVLGVVGLVVALQGIGTVPGGMNGESRWTGLGIALIIGAAVLAVIIIRVRRNA